MAFINSISCALISLCPSIFIDLLIVKSRLEVIMIIIRFLRVYYSKGWYKAVQNSIGKGSRKHINTAPTRTSVRRRAKKIPGLPGSHHTDNHRASTASNIHGSTQLSGPHERDNQDDQQWHGSLEEGQRFLSGESSTSKSIEIAHWRSG